jgi:hypothetical protein
MLQFGSVVYVTVAKDNGVLLRHLTQRREIMNNLDRMHTLEVQHESDNKISPPPVWKAPFHVLGLMQDVEYWRYKLQATEDAISDELSHDTFHCKRVYVTFEDEESQRNCLLKLTTGYIFSALDMVGSTEVRYRFGGGNVLKVEEAPEPDDIIWHNLQLPLWSRMLQQAITTVLTVGLVVAAYFAIYYAKQSSSFKAALVVSLINTYVE